MFDGFDNLYVGQPGAILSFPVTQWIRWRRPVIGMPTTPRILGHGQLLVATHLGQVQVFDGHRGIVVGNSVDLVNNVDPSDFTRGLSDCGPAQAGCPVAAAPAFSATTGMVVLSLWEPDAPAAVLVGLKYHPGQSPLLTREWTSNAVGAGVLASPVLSGDGSTIYVNGRDERLWALNAADGKPKWSVPLKFVGADAAVGDAGRADRLGRRAGHPTGRLQGRRRPRPGGMAPQRRQPAVDVEPGRSAASATPW